jgi:hypothetical protein
VNVVVLDVNPIVTENGMHVHTSSSSDSINIYSWADNIAYYKCDVSIWAEVEAVSKRIIEDV